MTPPACCGAPTGELKKSLAGVGEGEGAEKRSAGSPPRRVVEPDAAAVEEEVEEVERSWLMVVGRAMLAAGGESANASKEMSEGSAGGGAVY